MPKRFSPPCVASVFLSLKRLAARLTGNWRRLTTSYHPERHYMRGHKNGGR